MQFLSREEQECLQFFEKTIDSLEDSLEESDQRTRLADPTVGSSSSSDHEVDGPVTSSPHPAAILSSLQARPPSPKDQDIIDLVRPEPDLVQSKQSTVFNPITPGSGLECNGFFVQAFFD